MASRAVAATVSKPPPTPSPTPFATLLRRSKFTTYDPAIKQVYTNYGGHAHRGNWGLKRPISLRQRHNAFITVKAVDTIEKQTDWSSGQRQARWMKRWDEFGVKAEVAEQGRWSKTINYSAREIQLDSEFCPKDGSLFLRDDVQGGLVPNLRSMAPDQRKRYLKKLRALRPEFQQYLRDKHKDREQTPFEQSQRSNPEHFHFIAEHVKAEYARHGSRAIQPQPHPTGGLSYVQIPPLQARFWRQPLPGMVLQAMTPRTTSKEEAHVAGVAGMTLGLLRKHSDTVPPVMTEDSDGWHINKTDRTQGEFRMISAVLYNPPKAVGRTTEGLKGVGLSGSVVNVKGVNHAATNVHYPGSGNYVGEEPVAPRSVPRYSNLRDPSQRAANERILSGDRSSWRGAQLLKNKDLPKATLDKLSGILGNGRG